MAKNQIHIPAQMFLRLLSEYGDKQLSSFEISELYKNFACEYRELYEQGWRFVFEGKMRQFPSVDPESGTSELKMDTLWGFHSLFRKYCKKVQDNVTFVSFNVTGKYIKIDHLMDKQESLSFQFNKKEVRDFVEKASIEEISEILHLIRKQKLMRRSELGLIPTWGSSDVLDENGRKLTAPLFFKRFYSSLEVDGTIEKSSLRELDSELMSDIEQYISRRATRNNGPGDAEGLSFVTSRQKKRMAIREVQDASPAAQGSLPLAQRKPKIG